jgi:hypothetical protein
LGVEEKESQTGTPRLIWRIKKNCHLKSNQPEIGGKKLADSYVQYRQNINIQEMR